MQREDAWRAVVTPWHKLAVNVAGEVTHMFDLENDPYEMSNMANVPDHAQLQKTLLAELRRWTHKTADPFPETPARAKTMYATEFG